MSIQPMETSAGEKEVRFVDRQEIVYPHLMRLCMDFNFRVFRSDASQYRLSADNEEFISPAFSQLEALEQHVHRHMVDILHNYLRGDSPVAKH